MKTRISRLMRPGMKTRKLTRKLTSKSRKQKTSKPASKQASKTRQHIYYIVRCHYDKLNRLDESLLEKHLHRLGLVPDSKAMSYTERQYTTLAARNRLTTKQFCTSFNRKIHLKLPIGLVRADVFFL